VRGLTKIISVGGKELTIKELRSDELRAFIKDLEISQFDPDDVPDLIMFKVFMSAIRMITGITKEEWVEFYPSEQRVIISTARAVNGDFFTLAEAAARMSDNKALLEIFGKG
jgi:hypothetical protein